MATFVTVQEETIEVSQQHRVARLTASQVRNLRHSDWFQDYEVGRVNPVTGRLERRSIRLIAALSGFTERSVRGAIASVRKARQELAQYEDL